jgi:hypothetical protein
VRDLRTGEDPVRLAPSVPGGIEHGDVRIAGDIVAWDVDPADPAEPDLGVRVRNVATMDPAGPVPGLSELHDLSTGYVAGHGCDGDGGCSHRAVSLVDGTVTTVGTERTMAVHGNLLAFITPDNLPAVMALPEYDDAPRLLASTGAAASADPVKRYPEWRVATSRLLTSCRLEIRDAEGALMRSLPCTGNGLDAYVTVQWNGRGPTAWIVPSGEYSWRIVGATGDLPLVGYDGSTSGLSGTITVEGGPT